MITGNNIIGLSNMKIGEPYSFTQDQNGVFHQIRERKDIIIGNDVLFNPFVIVEYGTVRDTKIGDNTKIDGFVMIGHDVQIGKSCLINTGAKILGHVTVGDFSRINAGAIIHQKVKIGNNCIIGANSYVRHDVPDNTVVYGTPAREIKNYKYPRKTFS